MARIGFVGVGNMGGPMARNLMKAGHQVAAYDLVPAALDAVVQAGATRAASAAETAGGADFVITMLPAGRHVREAWLGSGGLAKAIGPQAHLIDCSTIDVATAREVAAAVSRPMLDAPVSGGVMGAEAGTLTFMVGGAADAFATCEPILKAMGRNILRCGDVGAGQAAKLCNNMTLAATMIVTCEAFVLAEKLGLSHKALFDVLSTSSAQSWAVSTYCPVPGPVPTSPANRDYRPGFAAALMAKDLGLAQEAAAGVGANAEVGAHALALYRKFLEQGGGETDFSGIIQMIRGGQVSAMVTQFVSPRLTVMGGGAVAKLGEVLQQLGLSKPLVVTDPWMVSSRTVEKALAPLRAAGMTPAVFSDTVPDPTDTVIEAGVRVMQGGDYDCLVGFGGGSPMDTAKAMAILAAAPAGAKMREFKVPAQANRGALPIICVPTTAGTGSEATRFTVITDVGTDEKMLIAGLGALPLAAVVDFELSMTVPPRTTADTGIDSLTHALEAFVSQRANAESDEYALRAMRLIAPNLRAVYTEPGNRAAREAMMKGAMIAGLAFSNASVALVHGMSRPIGAHFHVPHGLSNAMLLPAVTEYSLNAALPRYAEAARAMGVATTAEGDQSAAAKLLEELRALNRDLAVPTPAQYGIAKEKWDGLVPLMAKQALASGSPANNPAVPDAAAIEALYAKVHG